MYIRKAIIRAVILSFFISPTYAHNAQQITCKGKVVDSEGDPLVAAKVTVYEMEFDGIAGNFMLRKVDETITEENGTFLFKVQAKPEGGTFYECKVVAAKQGYSLGWTVWSMREDLISDIKLGKPAKLEGVIVDQADQPITSAEVRANLSRNIEINGEQKGQWLPGISPFNELGTQTDNQGRFFFNNLPVDVNVDLLVTYPGKAIIYTYQSETSKFAFKSGQTDIKVVLPNEARIEGKITDPDTGEGIAGTKFAVVATSSGLFYYRFVHTTNDDGSFKIGGLQTDRYLLRNGGFPNTYIEAVSGTTTNITIKADRLSRPHGITGVVHDQEGKPVPNAMISTDPSVTETILTNTKGEFNLKSKRPLDPESGIIYLIARHKERNLAAATELDNSSGNLDIKLSSGIIFSGIVVDVNSRAIPNAEISVHLRALDEDRISSEFMEKTSDGNFEIRALPPGFPYSIEITADGYGRYSQTIYTSQEGEKGVDLGRVILKTANLSISGIVVDSDGKPMIGTMVTCAGSEQPFRDTITDADGKFILNGICTGSLQVAANTPNPGRMYGNASVFGGAKDIKIVVTPWRSNIADSSDQGISLLQKELPELKAINVELSSIEKNKKILICFFDIEQRPSRNCIQELNKKVEELKVKDITVIAIQASKTDKNNFNDWIKEYNINIPMGFIEADSEQTRFNWGVKALPWLILTDKQHIVTAEGFSLAELDQKLK
ncbi:MAG: redoxin domain-containing protein [Sedimentisphaerales bacterium]|nr:redoxin domain-containing protein [Sedimentisphaerales bacterium]